MYVYRADYTMEPSMPWTSSRICVRKLDTIPSIHHQYTGRKFNVKKTLF